MDIARAAVEAAQAQGAEYADARANRLLREDLELRNGRLDRAESCEDAGIGVRVLVDGCWGFAAAPGTGAGDARALGKRAVELARALGPARVEPVKLAAQDAQKAEYRTPVGMDPFKVMLADKLELMQACDRSMVGASETVVRETSISSRREEQWLVSSEGTEIYQELVRTGAGISTTATANGTVERRSWPASFGGNYRTAGWEFVIGLKLPDHGARMRDESVALCSADPCPAGRRDLILTGNQLMLQIHESVGHPNELDRVYGHEVDLAGASFATPEKLGTFRYGSDIVNLVADSTVPGGLDTRGFDDDGVPSGKWHVVKDGIFQGYHTNREWADTAGDEHSRGTNRAEGWFNPPIIRITNLSLMPGTWSLDELIADTEDGVLCDTVKMWSIDQRRLNFQFTTEIGWEIKDGRRGRMLRNPTYQGTTPDFWRSCDAICDEGHWELWGVPNCGKGNPMQVAEMSHGAAPARFRGVTFVA
ncbi:MAG: TldD/PmbA family protein [Planctomycetota bacterium]|nr:TldD/PmbA family protein [Planctomycetota bacterium]